MSRSTWTLPVLIAVATIIGLVSALTGDGWRDALAWIALAVPLIATGWAIVARPTPSSNLTARRANSDRIDR